LSWVAFNFLPVLGAGLVIKIMDDYLDQDIDRELGKKNWTQKAGRAAFPYALLILTLSLALNPPLSGTLFLAAYSLGMVWLPSEKPLNLWPAWLEIVFVIIISCYLFSWEGTLGSFLLIGTVDRLDNFLEKKKKTWSGAFFPILLFLAILIWDLPKALTGVIAYPLVLLILEVPYSRWKYFSL